MDLTQLFCKVDDFVKENPNLLINKLISAETSKRKYTPRERKLSNSEVMTICILFHLSSYRNFKAFYCEHVIKHLNSYFPNLVAYNRFVELMRENIEFLAAYLQSLFGQATGISYIDSIQSKCANLKECLETSVRRNLISA
jgi:hypothetical protein